MVSVEPRKRTMKSIWVRLKKARMMPAMNAVKNAVEAYVSAFFLLPAPSAWLTCVPEPMPIMKEKA